MVRRWRAPALALGLVAVVVSAALVPAGEGRAASSPQDCFWTSVFDEKNGNLFFPDTAVNYYLGRLELQPGGELLVHGRFPHARYTSFNVYDEFGQPVDALPDVGIHPDRRSTNPFIAGHVRTRAMRSYTVRVVAGSGHHRRARNTVYLGGDGQRRFVGSLVYRVYLPDRGRNQFGGTGLPEVEVRLPDGTTVDQPGACSAPTNQPSTGVNEADRRSGGPATPSWTTASDSLDWERFFNMPRATLRQFSEEAADAAGHDQRGGFFSDANNAYVYAMVARRFGNVLVLRGRMPDIPETLEGEQICEAAPLRYWSMCTGSVLPTGVTDTVGCVHDEQVPRGPRGRFTIAVSTPEHRPANARRACGVAWMPWGVRPNAVMIMRNQLPSPGFDRAIQNVRRPGTERKVLGPFLPHSDYMTTRSFEQRGCPAVRRD